MFEHRWQQLGVVAVTSSGNWKKTTRGLKRAMYREAVLAQGARPSQPGHVHEPPPKKHREGGRGGGGGASKTNVPYLSSTPDGASLHRSEAAASVWGLAALFPTLQPLPLPVVRARWRLGAESASG